MNNLNSKKNIKLLIQFYLVLILNYYLNFLYSIPFKIIYKRTSNELIESYTREKLTEKSVTSASSKSNRMMFLLSIDHEEEAHLFSTSAHSHL